MYNALSHILFNTVCISPGRNDVLIKIQRAHRYKKFCTTIHTRRYHLSKLFNPYRMKLSDIWLTMIYLCVAFSVKRSSSRQSLMRPWINHVDDGIEGIESVASPWGVFSLQISNLTLYKSLPQVRKNISSHSQKWVRGRKNGRPLKKIDDVFCFTSHTLYPWISPKRLYISLHLIYQRINPTTERLILFYIALNNLKVNNHCCLRRFKMETRVTLQ